MRIQLFTFLLISGLFISCHFGKSPTSETPTEGRVPVTTTTIKIGTLNETVELNAISQFLLKTTIKSIANGYLQEVAITLGQQISKGEKLFVVHSKESKSLGNTVDKLDSMFHFNGEIQINAPGNGFILQFTYRDGDYVQDGEVLATIGDSKSLVFLLELPYELLPFLSLNKTVLLTLPDGKQLKGHVTNSLPSMDAQSQTQSYIIRIDHSGQIPENLVAKVQFVKKLSSNAMILPKAALLTDEKLLYSA